MRIRRATAADLPHIARLARQLAEHVGDPDPGSDPNWLQESGFGPDPWFECLVAVVDEKIAGFALYSRVFEAHTGQRRLWMGDLCVAKECRGIGIGGQLMTAVNARAIELHCAAVSFEVAKDNETAKAFYAALGATAQDQVLPFNLPCEAP